tara:strand:- start:5 stop:3169 length:3165 start_codon:yes stop_codon:yes gene_type:complete
MGGDDTNSGTLNSPFATVNKALSVMGSGDTCFIRTGSYHEEVILDGKNNIVIMPYMGEWVVFDGTMPIQSSWTTYTGNIYKTTLNKHIWQLFVDQQEMVMARWPNGNFSDKSIYTWDSWASGIVDSTAGFPIGSYNGFELVDSTKKDLGATGLDLTGAIGIMNVGSFKTFNREITSHNTQDNFFSYNIVPNNTYRDKHHHFFVEGKLELLDQPNEWFYDTTSKTLYLYADNGQNPNGREIKGKVQDYAFTINNSSNIILKNIYFFSSTFFAKSSNNILIEECHFSFPNCSKRMLREFEVAPNVSSLGQSGAVNEVHNSVIRKCLFEYTDGEALRIYGDSNIVENCYMQYIDYTVSELPFLMIGVYFNGDANKFLYNTVHNAAASAFLAPGTTPEFAYNDVWSTGALQSDGSVYQGTSATVQNSNIHHNYIHDTPKYALRFDAPGGSPGQAGQYGKMHHNIAVRTNGIMVKGNHHYICYNTTFSSKKNGLIILDEDNSNDSSYIHNNFSEEMSAHRANQIPIPGIASNNWNGYDNTGVNFYDLMDTNTYLPLSSSLLVDGGVSVSAINHTINGAAPDIGALELGILPWQAGVDWSPTFYPWIQGCTDSSSCQYNPLANIDDGSCGYANSAAIVLTACDSLVWNGVNYTSSGIYNQTLTNVSGCDSVVTLDLGIIAVDTSVSYDISSSTLTALATSATYQWLDCNNINTPIVGETNQSFSPTSNGSYAVEVTENGCTAISSCYAVNNLMSLSFNILDSIYCNGGLADIEAIASSGNAPYTYLWSNGTTGSNIYLSAGSYTCTVTDAFGFTFLDSIIITEPPIMTYTYNVNNSNIDFDINGGTPSYFLELYGHSASQYYDSTYVVPHTFQNLPCDDYSFIISDNNNCTHPDNNNITITIPVPFTNTVTNNSPILTSDVQGASYQWIDCNNNNSPIVGETNQSFTASVNGDYAVEVTKSNCIDISPCESVNNVGINSNNKINYVLYPNPNDGSFTLERSFGNEQVEINIYDLSGQSVFSDSWKSGRKKNVECNLSSGYYHMHIVTSNKVDEVREIIIH